MVSQDEDCDLIFLSNSITLPLKVENYFNHLRITSIALSTFSSGCDGPHDGMKPSFENFSELTKFLDCPK